MQEALTVQIGDVLLGKYRVESLLGRGGMGIVVAARHLDLGELFAIKFLNAEGLQNPQALERFLREARAAARLKGEHVAKVIDVGRLPNGAPYMVMEHLAGNDLRRVSKARGPLPINEAVLYVLHACEALAEAHSVGIVHRDIKPANLFLVARPNGTPCVKVLDFGISKQLSPDAVELTQTGELVGSPVYMSPEQMIRARHVDARTDIWSLGMVLFKLVTGKLPFLGDNLPEMVARVLQEETLPPSAFRPDVPVELDNIVRKCLQKKPEDRYASVEEFAEALRGLQLSMSGASHAVSGLLSPGAALDSAQSGSFPPSDSRNSGLAKGVHVGGFAPAVANTPPLPTTAIGTTPAQWTPNQSTPPMPSGDPSTGASWGRTGAGASVGPPRPRRTWLVGVAAVAILLAGISLGFVLRPNAQPATAIEPPANSGDPALSSTSTATAPASVSTDSAPAQAGSDAPSSSATVTSSAKAPPSKWKPGPSKKHEGIF